MLQYPSREVCREYRKSRVLEPSLECMEPSLECIVYRKSRVYRGKFGGHTAKCRVYSTRCARARARATQHGYALQCIERSVEYKARGVRQRERDNVAMSAGMISREVPTNEESRPAVGIDEI